jgi:hypothetical protein
MTASVRANQCIDWPLLGDVIGREWMLAEIGLAGRKI